MHSFSQPLEIFQDQHETILTDYSATLMDEIEFQLRRRRIRLTRTDRFTLTVNPADNPAPVLLGLGVPLRFTKLVLPGAAPDPGFAITPNSADQETNDNATQDVQRRFSPAGLGTDNPDHLVLLEPHGMPGQVVVETIPSNRDGLTDALEAAGLRQIRLWMAVPRSRYGRIDSVWAGKRWPADAIEQAGFWLGVD